MTCGLQCRVLALLKAVSLIRPLWNSSMFLVVCRVYSGAKSISRFLSTNPHRPRYAIVSCQSVDSSHGSTMLALERERSACYRRCNGSYAIRQYESRSDRICRVTRLRTFSLGRTLSANWSSTSGRGVADRMDGVGTQGAMNYAAVPDIPVNFAVNRFGKFLSRHVSGQVIRSVFAETIFFVRRFGAPFYSKVMRESPDPTYLSCTAIRGKANISYQERASYFSTGTSVIATHHR